MATSLGGTTLADPAYGDEGYSVAAIDVGMLHETADGTVHYDHTRTRRVFSLSWQRITAAQKEAIYTKYGTKSTQAFVAPNGTSCNVIVAQNSWTESYIEDASGTARYNCALRLLEVPAVA